MLVEVQEGGRFNIVCDRNGETPMERAREKTGAVGERASGRAYVSRRQRRGALMGADAGSDWVSARLTRAHPSRGILGVHPPRGEGEKLRRT